MVRSLNTAPLVAQSVLLSIVCTGRDFSFLDTNLMTRDVAAKLGLRGTDEASILRCANWLAIKLITQEEPFSNTPENRQLE